MSEYEIQTTAENRQEVIASLRELGIATDYWDDGTMDFRCYDNAAEDALTELLEKRGIEYRLI